MSVIEVGKVSMGLALAAVVLSTVTPGTTPTAGADDIGYLVNVTVRPGYNFPNADAALGYGRGLCDQVGAGVPYRDIVGSVQRDFGTTDDYQASYLISQAVDQLCSAQIWRLRQSAAGYLP